MTLEKIFQIARKTGIDEISAEVEKMRDEDIFEALIVLKQGIKDTPHARKKDFVECLKEIHCLVL